MNSAGRFEQFKFEAEWQASHIGGHVNVDRASELSHTNSIVISDAQLLFTGDYKRSGVDLILSKDGRDLVVHDYFKGEKRPSLSSPDGAHLTGDIVNALVGNVEYAQSNIAPDAGKVIGHVSKVSGSATAIRNGVSIILNQGDNVDKGDVVQSGIASSVSIAFIDGTVFGLSSNARMVLNEMIYDPNGASNSSLLTLVQGTISFVAGETAKHGDMKVDTPVATMGIRGTAVLVQIDFQVPGQGAAPVNFQVLAEPDGHTGSYVLFSKPTDGSQPVIVGTVNQNGQNYSYTPAQGLIVGAAPPLSLDAQAVIEQVFTQGFQNYTLPQTNPQSISPGGGSSTPPPAATPLDTSPIKGVPLGTTTSPIPISITLPDSSIPDNSNAFTPMPTTIILTPIHADATVVITTAGGGTNQQNHAISGFVPGAAAAGAAVTLVDTFNGIAKPIGTATLQANGTFTAANITLVGNGVHSIVAIETDGSGQLVVSEPVVFTFSTITPTVAINNVGGATSQLSHKISGSVSADDVTAPGSTVVLYDNGVTTPIGTAVVQADGSWTANVTLAGNGTHSIVAVDTDLAGNLGTSAPLVLTIDTVSPAVAITSAAGPTNIATYAISGTVSADAAAPGSTVTLLDTVNGVTTAIGTAIVQADGSWTANNLTLVGDGTHSIVAVDTDLAGNHGTSAPVLFILSTVTPAVAITNAGGPTNQQVHTIFGSVSAVDGTAPGSTVTLYDNGSLTPIGTAVVQPDGNWSTTITLVGNGPHSIVAQDTDLAGNLGAAAPVVFTLETAAPTVAVTTPASATHFATQSIEGFVTGDATVGSTVTLYDNGSLTPLAATVVQAGGSWTTSVALVSGINSIVAQDTDLAGNLGTAAPVVFTLQTAAPTVAITTAGATTNVAIHTITGIVSADVTADFSTVTLYDNGGLTPIATATVQDDGSWTGIVTLVGAGAHVITAQDVDTAGNLGISAPVEFTLETAAPMVAISTTGGATSHQIHTIIGTVSADAAAPGSTVTLYDNGGSTAIGTAVVQADGTWIATDVTLVGEGVHSITAKDVDLVGNSGTSTPVVFMLDTVAPTVAITTAGGPTNGVTHTITGMVIADTTAPGSTVILYDNGGTTAIGTAVVQADGSWSATNVALVTGVNSIVAEDTDIAGNIGSSAPVVFTLDTVPPIVAIATAGGPTNVATHTITGTVSADITAPGSTVILYDNGGTTAIGAAVVQADGTWAATSVPLVSGVNSIVAKDTDLAGNVGTSAAIAFTLDTIIPTVAITSPGLTTNQANQSITGTGEAGTAVTLFDNGTELTLPTITVDQNGHWSSTFALVNGTNSLTAHDTDAAGNIGTSATVTFTLDTTALTVTESLADDTGSSGTDKITSDDALTGTGLANALVHFSIDGTAIAATATANAQGVWSFTPTGLADGTHSVVASETDSVGNTGTATLSFTLATEGPTVTIGNVNTATGTVSGTVNPANVTAGTTITVFDSVAGNNSPFTPYAASLLTANHNLVNGLGGTDGFGTQSLATGDDNSSSAIDITSVFGTAGVDFFGTNYTSLYINNNGNITFASSNGAYTPSAINGGYDNPIIAPFWADVDTRGGAGVSTGGNATGANQVFYNLDAADGVLTITWDDVGYYYQQTDKLDAFQVQLISLGDGNFDIVYRYQSINWTTGDASGGTNGLGGTPARAGYSAGDGNSAHYFELPQSGDQSALLALATTAGNTGIAGVDVFQVLNGQVGTTETAVGTATVQSDGTWVVNNVTVPSGSNSLTAQDTDLAGNTGTSAPVTLNQSNLAPAGIAGSAINLGLTQSGGASGEEITITGAPANWTMVGATHNADGSWTALTNNFSTLAITPDVDFVGSIVLHVTETWRNSDGSLGSAFVADNLEAFAPGTPIFAVAGDDHLTGTANANLFVFAQPIGNDVIYNFNATSDKIDLVGFDNFASFADIQSHIADDADGNVVITVGVNETITVEAVYAADITASNLEFNQEPVTANPGTLQISDGSYLPLSGTIANDGTIELGSTGDETHLQVIEHGLTLEGAGQVVLSDSAKNTILGTSPDVTLTNVDNTISGAGQIGSGQLTLVNEGIIDATGTNSLTIDTGANVITNSGTLEATGTGGLIFQSDVINSGLLSAHGAGSVLSLNGTVTNTGIVEAVDPAASHSPMPAIELNSAHIIGGMVEAISGGEIKAVSGVNSIDAAVMIDASSSFVVDGGATAVVNAASSTTINDGTIEVQSGGTATWGGVLSGTGAVHIDGGASIEIGATSAINAQTVTFEQSTGTLKLDNAQLFHSDIIGFTGNGELSGSDQIDLANVNLNSGNFTETYNTTNDVLTVSDGASTANLHFIDFSGSFSFAADGDNGTIVYDPPVSPTPLTPAVTQLTGAISLHEADISKRGDGFVFNLLGVKDSGPAEAGGGSTLVQAALRPDFADGSAPGHADVGASVVSLANHGDGFLFSTVQHTVEMHGENMNGSSLDYAALAAALPRADDLNITENGIGHDAHHSMSVAGLSNAHLKALDFHLV